MNTRDQPSGRNVYAHPGDQVSVDGLLQITVGRGTAEIHLPRGVKAELKDGQVIITRDPLSELPRLADVRHIVLARAEAAGGARAVHRLTGHLNGVMARHPGTLASSNTGWNPAWDGTAPVRSGAPTAESLAEPIGCLFRDAGGYWMGRTVLGCGILGREWRWTPRG